MIEYESIDVTHTNAPELLGKLIEKLGGMDIYFHVAGIGYENLELDPQREVNIFNEVKPNLCRIFSTSASY